MNKNIKLVKKVLLARFGAIGDIVLTTPVIRCLKEQRPDIELHFATKKTYSSVLESNPYIDKLHFYDGNLRAMIKTLQKEDFDLIIDLQNNQKSWVVKKMIGKPSQSFYKLNIQKWLLVNFKWNRLPDIHVVDRYLDTVADLGVKNDGKGLDYFIPKQEEINISTHFPSIKPKKYIAAVIGANHFTKQMPPRKWTNLCELIEKPVIIIGGPAEAEKGEEIAAKAGNHVFNACGKYNLHQSASIVKQAEKVITHDTGFMHIAASFDQNIASIWGNTVPQLGMYPYLPEGGKGSYEVFEVLNLKCRPCSKIGYKKCPKKHFACMELIDETLIADWANQNITQ